jgi:predicted PurR-regulated permease PerM
MNDVRHDLTHTTLAVLFIGGLLAATLWVLRPFLPAVIWATMIVVATWPLMISLQRRLWGKRWLVVTLMTLTMLLGFVVPFLLAISALVRHGDQIADWAGSLGSGSLPPPPSWLQHVPLIGEEAAAAWQDLIASGIKDLAVTLAPYAQGLLRWFVAQASGLGMMSLQFLLSVLLAAVLYAQGEQFTAFVERFGRRLAGERGVDAVVLAGKAIRAVALGVVVTAVLQTLVGGIGLAVAGVPFAALLTAAMFLLAVAQIGATPVLAGAALWLYWTGNIGWAIAMVVWAVVVGTMDNVLRPILIRQGADLPLLLIFAGVVGGLLAFGLVGIFVGPTVLAVAYTLLNDWLDEKAR